MLVLSALFLKYKKDKLGGVFFTSSFLVFFVLMPFFITNVGKVSLKDTFKYLLLTREEKLKASLYGGDIYKVYFYAKKTLPKETNLQSNFAEIYTYNKYFSLKKFKNEDVKYQISTNCFEEFISIYNEGEVHLCGKR